EASAGFPTGTSPLGQVADLAFLQQATTILNGTPARESADMCVRVLLRLDDRPLRFCDRYVVQDDGSSFASGDMLGPLAPLAAEDLDAAMTLISTARPTSRCGCGAACTWPRSCAPAPRRRACAAAGPCAWSCARGCCTAARR